MVTLRCGLLPWGDDARWAAMHHCVRPPYGTGAPRPSDCSLRPLGGELERHVEIGRLDDPEAGEVLLRLHEGPVGVGLVRISSIRLRKSSPPSLAYASRSRRPLLELDHVPAVRAELRLQRGGADPRDHPVERLAVEIDDPEDVASLRARGSASASQMMPSSSSASPRSEM